ncbi:SDR family oxidoreductase [bacterium]|nr:SDR family oxidoreductase [candidate division CSSED10-310 bacterium]
MDLGISGKIAAVAASSKGLGFAAARELAREGVRVGICSSNEQRVAHAIRMLREDTGAEVAGTVADLATADGPAAFISFVTSELGAPDILVTNNGGPPATTHETTTERHWAAAYDMTLMSCVRLVTAALPAMKERRWGRIVNITSVSVKQPIDGLLLSNALRAGIVGYARTLANEVGAFGITVNNVCPGYTRTERLQELARTRNDDFLAQLGTRIPLGRIGEPEELAALITFLASTRAAFITGATIPVDGGFYRGLM